ncbi:FAD-dependent oxidoreductase [Pelagibacterium montanilacus]|uniref:FAD-dependent oxidoreductase n=1 Tax=Pelagibacterium montanilacus TaxID=2185280 RepID=UPI000F8EDF38|nr:FAD-dependent oxidoreductase [Pelagibacterium montanilacus]
MTEPNRLTGDLGRELAYPLVDRSMPITLTVDGTRLSALAGDTVLSALLANGIDTLGTHRGHRLALDDTTAPEIALAGNAARADLAMPAALCPAVDGLDYVTIGKQRSPGPLRAISRLMGGGRRSLDHDIAEGLELPGRWIDEPAARTIEVDLAVIGGGISGMSAALAAAQRGLRVALLERDMALGGLSRLFGRTEGQPPPEEAIPRAIAEVSRSRHVQVFTGTEAFDIRDGTIQAIRVPIKDGVPRPERVAVRAKHIVLATGLSDTVPVFPGNRLPGVLSPGFAWRMAAHYSIWIGQSAHLHTATNAAYRLALLGLEQGKTIVRASDPRINPQTRFIEFCKAYGFRHSWGVQIAEITRSGRAHPTLTARLLDAQFGAVNLDEIVSQCLLVSGGWQPNLDLWVRAGGSARFAESTGKLVITGRPELGAAGSLAGYSSLSGCRDSGEAVIETLLDGTTRAVEDPQIDPVYETPDDKAYISPAKRSGLAPAYLGKGPGLTALHEGTRRSVFGDKRQSAHDESVLLSSVLAPSEIAGAIVAGLLSPSDTEVIVDERCVLPRRFEAPGAGLALPTEPSGEAPYPPFLKDRYGPDQAVFALVADASRRIEPGSLVFANTDDRDPTRSVGVVMGPAGAYGAAILTGWSEGQTVYVRDGHACITAGIGARIEPGSVGRSDKATPAA